MFNYYYLELQDKINNGFMNLNNNVLKKRFSCKKISSVLWCKTER